VIRVGADPWRVYMSHDGKYAITPNNGDETISIIDVQANKVAATLAAGPNMVGVNFAGGKAFVISATSGACIFHQRRRHGRRRGFAREREKRQAGERQGRKGGTNRQSREGGARGDALRREPVEALPRHGAGLLRARQGDAQPAPVRRARDAGVHARLTRVGLATSGGARRVLVATFVTLGLTYGFWYSYAVFLVAFLREFGWSRSVVAGAFSTLVMVHGLSGPLLGWLVERVGPRLRQRGHGAAGLLELGEEDERRRALLNLGLESVQQRRQLLLTHVFAGDDLEACSLQFLRHRLGVFDGLRQQLAIVRISGVADHQGDSIALGLLACCRTLGLLACG